MTDKPDETSQLVKELRKIANTELPDKYPFFALLADTAAAIIEIQDAQIRRQHDNLTAFADIVIKLPLTTEPDKEINTPSYGKNRFDYAQAVPDAADYPHTHE